MIQLDRGADYSFKEKSWWTIDDLFEEVIDKWWSICLIETEDYGTYDCAFCREFYRGIDTLGFPRDYCSNDCPVKNWSGDDLCANTPYEQWKLYIKNKTLNGSHRVFDALSYELAKQELKFLWTLWEGII